MTTVYETLRAARAALQRMEAQPGLPPGMLQAIIDIARECETMAHTWTRMQERIDVLTAHLARLEVAVQALGESASHGGNGVADD